MIELERRAEIGFDPAPFGLTGGATELGAVEGWGGPSGLLPALTFDLSSPDTVRVTAVDLKSISEITHFGDMPGASMPLSADGFSCCCCPCCTCCCCMVAQTSEGLVK